MNPRTEQLFASVILLVLAFWLAWLVWIRRLLPSETTWLPFGKRLVSAVARLKFSSDANRYFYAGGTMFDCAECGTVYGRVSLVDSLAGIEIDKD